MTPKEKANELKAQFGDNAKYVALEVREEVREYCDDLLYPARMTFWYEVLTELNQMQ